MSFKQAWGLNNWFISSGFIDTYLGVICVEINWVFPHNIA